MATTARIPPGRAGRIWLRRRLTTATRGCDQLDRKLRILLTEQQRLHLQAERSHERWVAACEHARTWLLRAVVVGGQDAVRAATAPERAQVEIVWASAMGLRYPTEALLTHPVMAATVPANAAVGPAVEAYRDALLAGARAAAADDAARRVDSEIAVTRRRLRALDKRWLPSLTNALTELELVLEQGEQEDGIRLRRAVEHRRSP